MIAFSKGLKRDLYFLGNGSSYLKLSQKSVVSERTDWSWLATGNAAGRRVVNGAARRSINDESLDAILSEPLYKKAVWLEMFWNAQAATSGMQSRFAQIEVS